MDNIDRFINKNYDEIIIFFKELVSVRTVLNKETNEYPFGVDIGVGQEIIKNYCDTNGINYMNFNNYLSYSHYGNSDDYINVLTHLDIVPEGDINKWNYDPYVLSIDNNKIIGRGVIDNKGSIIYGLMTIKYLLENNIKTTKGIRVIYGNDEESGFRDLKLYKKHNNTQGPNFVFDNLFPVTKIEKGVINFDLELENTDNCMIYGGTKRNVIAECCEYKLNDNRIYSEVKPGHGSISDSRENSIYNVLEKVDNSKLNNIIKLINFIRNEQLYKENYCSINLGQIKTESNKIIIELEMRYVLNTINNGDDIFEIVKHIFKNYTVVKKNILKPIVFDEKLVNYWLNEYNEHYNTNYDSQISGYITYAHLLDNSVSVGPFTKNNDSLHCFDEYIYEDEFKENLKFYIKSLTKYIR